MLLSGRDRWRLLLTISLRVGHSSLKRAELVGGLEDYSERPEKVVIARSEATCQSHEIASLRPEHYAVQGFVRNDT